MANRMLLSEKISIEIRNRIEMEEFSEGEFLPSERDLMKSYEVSRVTIRKALSMLESNGLVQRKPGVGYRVQTKEENTIHRNTKSIGLILNEESDTQTKGIQILQRMISDLGYSIFYGINKYELEKENDCIERFRSSGVDGIVIIPAVHGSGPSALATLIDENFPVVGVGEPRSWCVGYRAINKMSIVGLDNSSVMNLMLEQIHNLGHKRIAYVDNIAMKNISTIRKKVFTEYLNQTKESLNFDPFIYLDPMVLNSGKKELASLFKNKQNKPDAIICQSVSVSTCVVQMLDSLDIKVPENVSIATFGLKEQEQTLFSSVDYSGEIYAQEIINSLLQQMNDKGSPKKTQIMSEFIERKSTRNLNLSAVMTKD